MSKWQVTLTDEERHSLEKMIHSGSALARTINKARILLLADHSQPTWHSDERIAKRLEVASNTALNTRKRFIQEGRPAALSDHPRPGRARKLDGAAEARLTTLACRQAPDG